jgi:hypothetical protein
MMLEASITSTEVAYFGVPDRDAVKKLNHQTNCLLHFLRDGNGLGVFWEHIRIVH